MFSLNNVRTSWITTRLFQRNVLSAQRSFIVTEILLYWQELAAPVDRMAGTWVSPCWAPSSANIPSYIWNYKMVKSPPLNASHVIDSLLSELCGPLDSLPLEDLEAVVWLDRARGEDASLLRQLLGHGLDVMTLKPAAAADHAHPELVSGACEPGRLPASDLPGLHRYKLVTMFKTFLIFCYHMGTLAALPSQTGPRQASCSPGAGPLGAHSALE